MSVVTLRPRTAVDALLAFTGLDALRGWRPAARPVPVTVDRAAETARTEGLAAVLIDVAGPYPLVIEGEVLGELAAGHRLVELAEGNSAGSSLLRSECTPGVPGGIDHCNRPFLEERLEDRCMWPIRPAVIS